MIHFLKSEKGTGNKRSYWLGTYHHIDQLRKVMSRGKRAFNGAGWEYKQCHETRISREAYLALKEYARAWHQKVRNVTTNGKSNGKIKS